LTRILVTLATALALTVSGMQGVKLAASAMLVRAGVAMMRVGSPALVPPAAVRLGGVPGATVLRVEVILQPRDPAALTRFATEVSTPGSPLFRHYLARGEFGPRFGAPGTAITSVLSALRGLGLRPGAVSSNHLAIPVTATAGQLDDQFQGV
jgi:subtilase family serine protease